MTQLSVRLATYIPIQSAVRRSRNGREQKTVFPCLEKLCSWYYPPGDRSGAVARAIWVEPSIMSTAKCHSGMASASLSLVWTCAGCRAGRSYAHFLPLFLHTVNTVDCAYTREARWPGDWWVDVGGAPEACGTGRGVCGV